MQKRKSATKKKLEDEEEIQPTKKIKSKIKNQKEEVINDNKPLEYGGE
jgi:hypothetical protein